MREAGVVMGTDPGWFTDVHCPWVTLNLDVVQKNTRFANTHLIRLIKVKEWRSRFWELLGS